MSNAIWDAVGVDPATAMLVRGVVRNKRVFTKQRWVARRAAPGFGLGGVITVEVRYDDACGNGHNTFSITKKASGCQHSEIAKVFPELAPFIKWHGFTSDGPLYYLANTLYLAGNRDSSGLLKGERRQIVNGRTNLPCWKLEMVDEEGNIGKAPQYVDSLLPPSCSHRMVYVPFTQTGDGKERELDAARRAAIWPEATDEQLCLPKDQLEALLVDRLPALLAEFKQAMLQLGFEWE